MRDTRACRACLSTDTRLVRIPDSWYRIFESLSGVQATKNDGYPNYFCIECKNHLHKAMAFRRRSRRAYFILKEIMMVRKEVNLQDIETVDRSTANLKSSLEVWNPDNSALYTMGLMEDDVNTISRIDMDVLNSCKVVSIQGDHIELPLEPPSALPSELPIDECVELEEMYQNADDDYGAQELDVESKEIEPYIDMEDIFKGLKEPESELENSEEEEKEENIEEEKKDRRKDDDVDGGTEITCGMKAHALVNYNMTKLTDDQQRKVFAVRRAEPSFARAPHSCAICIRVMADMESLIRHYDVHKERIGSKIICDICKDMFWSPEDLDLHVKENHMYLYSCKSCEKLVYTIRDAVLHKENHKGAKRAKRNNISAQVSDKFLLMPISDEEKVTHFKQHSTVHNAKECICNCGLVLPNKQYLKRHAIKHEAPKNVKKSYECAICRVYYKSEGGLGSHMDICHNYVYHCKECDYEAQNRFLAEFHMKTHRRKKFDCKICGEPYSKADSLGYHERRHHYPEMHTHHCVVCGHASRTLASLYRHQILQHTFVTLPEPPTENGEYCCKHCNVQFLSQKAYDTHLVKIHRDEAENLPWKCLPCRLLFDSEQDWQRHLYEKCKLSLNSFPSPCNMCGIVSENYNQYREHCRIHHPSNTSVFHKRKLCDSCGKTYVTTCICMLKMNRAMSKKYVCRECDFVCHIANTMVFHVIQKHTKRPFVCNICSLTFNRRFDCRDHIMKLHAPVTPYQCPLCAREFAHIQFLNEHTKSEHGVVVKLDRKLKKKKKRFFLYPNMKVNLSRLDQKILGDIKLEVADYTNQLFEVVKDYSDYLITSGDGIQNGGEEKAPKKQKK